MKKKLKLEFTQEMLEDLKNAKGFEENFQEILEESIKENETKEHISGTERSGTI